MTGPTSVSIPAPTRMRGSMHSWCGVQGNLITAPSARTLYVVSGVTTRRQPGRGGIRTSRSLLSLSWLNSTRIFWWLNPPGLRCWGASGGTMSLPTSSPAECPLANPGRCSTPSPRRVGGPCTSETRATFTTSPPARGTSISLGPWPPRPTWWPLVIHPEEMGRWAPSIGARLW